MPIKPENKHRYPANWREIRERILSRADHRCESCDVPNYAVGYRDTAGQFVPVEGNEWFDAAGRGELSHSEAARGVAWMNSSPGIGRFIVIVLTIAHLDHQPENNDENNLRALCQACHLRYDARQHAESARATRRRKLDGARPMLGQMEATK